MRLCAASPPGGVAAAAVSGCLCGGQLTPQQHHLVLQQKEPFVRCSVCSANCVGQIRTLNPRVLLQQRGPVRCWAMSSFPPFSEAQTEPEEDLTCLFIGWVGSCLLCALFSFGLSVLLAASQHRVCYELGEGEQRNDFVCGLCHVKLMDPFNPVVS